SRTACSRRARSRRCTSPTRTSTCDGRSWRDAERSSERREAMTEPEQQVVIRLGVSSLDDIPMGIIRLSNDKRVIYANRAAREAGGPKLVPGVSITTLSLDDASRRQLQEELMQRFVFEKGSDYPIRLLRPDTGTSVRLKVSGVPEYDAEGGVVGSI